jgi:hypothetical protein
LTLEEFIKTQIASVDELRALLLFQVSPQTNWDAAGLAGKLYLRPVVAAAVLSRLAAKGFLAADGDPPRYRFQPKSDEFAQRVAELAEVDRKLPVTLINMIYGMPKDLQAFADAFKIKKD